MLPCYTLIKHDGKYMEKHRKSLNGEAEAYDYNSVRFEVSTDTWTEQAEAQTIVRREV